MKSREDAVTIAEVEEAYERNSDRLLTADELAELVISERERRE